MKCPRCGKEVYSWVSPPMKCDCDKETVTQDSGQTFIDFKEVPNATK